MTAILLPEVKAIPKAFLFLTPSWLFFSSKVSSCFTTMGGQHKRNLFTENWQQSFNRINLTFWPQQEKEVVQTQGFFFFSKSRPCMELYICNYTWRVWGEGPSEHLSLPLPSIFFQWNQACPDHQKSWLESCEYLKVSLQTIFSSSQLSLLWKRKIDFCLPKSVFYIDQTTKLNGKVV